jgi:hypothetical protein
MCRCILNSIIIELNKEMLIFDHYSFIPFIFYIYHHSFTISLFIITRLLMYLFFVNLNTLLFLSLCTLFFVNLNILVFLSLSNLFFLNLNILFLLNLSTLFFLILFTLLFLCLLFPQFIFHQFQNILILNKLRILKYPIAIRILHRQYFLNTKQC